MLRRIVVGVDGSTESRAALRWAGDVARATEGSLRLVQTWEYPARAGIDPLEPSLSAPEDVDRRVRGRLASILREEGLDDLAGTELAVARGGAADALLREAAGFEADLLAVGSRGLGGFRTLLLGSVAQAVAQNAPCPVAIVREHVPLAPATPTIVVGVDGSPSSQRALAWTAELACRVGAEVVAVHAFEAAGPPVPPGLQVELRSQASEVLERWCGPLADADVSHRVIVRDGDARKVLGDVVEEIEPALVVVGSRGLGPLERMLLGSVAFHLTQHVRRPLVIVRTGAGEQPAT